MIKIQGFKTTSRGTLENLDKECESRVEDLVNKINNSGLSQKNKLKIIYDYLVNNCEILESFNMVGINQIPEEFAPGVTTANKYGPILYNKGVCAGFSRAFKDLAKRCGIKTVMIEGKHNGFGHGWIVALDNFDGRKPKHIDVYAGIKNRHSNKDIYEFFMIDTDKLYASGEYLEFENDLERAIEVLNDRIDDLDDEHKEEIIPGFRVTGRTD